MPGGPLKRQQMTHLKIYAGASHPHDAQNPKPLDIKAMNPKNAVRG
jgi:large subunit ribosomal protein L13